MKKENLKKISLIVLSSFFWSIPHLEAEEYATDTTGEYDAADEDQFTTGEKVALGTTAVAGAGLAGLGIKNLSDKRKRNNTSEKNSDVSGETNTKHGAHAAKGNDTTKHGAQAAKENDKPPSYKSLDQGLPAYNAIEHGAPTPPLSHPNHAAGSIKGGASELQNNQVKRNNTSEKNSDVSGEKKSTKHGAHAPAQVANAATASAAGQQAAGQHQSTKHGAHAPAQVANAATASAAGQQAAGQHQSTKHGAHAPAQVANAATASAAGQHHSAYQVAHPDAGLRSTGEGAHPSQGPRLEKSTSELEKHRLFRRQAIINQ